MEPLIIAAQMRPASRLRDDSVTLKFITAQEVTTELYSKIDGYRSVNGWLLFAVDKPNKSWVPERRSVEDKYSPSQLQRQALYALHVKRGGTDVDFDAFYRQSMERIRLVIVDSMG